MTEGYTSFQEYLEELPLPEGQLSAEPVNVDIVRGLSEVSPSEDTREVPLIIAAESRRPPYNENETEARVNGEVPAIPDPPGVNGPERAEAGSDIPARPADGGDGGNKPPKDSESSVGGEPDEPFGVRQFDTEPIRRRELHQAGDIQTATAQELLARHGLYVDQTGIESAELVLQHKGEQGIAEITIVTGDSYEVTFKDNAGLESRHIYVADKHTGTVIRQDRIPETPGLEIPRLGELPTREIQDLQRRRVRLQERNQEGGALDLDRHVVGPAQMRYIATLAERAEPRPVTLTELRDVAMNRATTTHLPEEQDAIDGAREFTRYVTSFLDERGYDTKWPGSITHDMSVAADADYMHLQVGLDRVPGGEVPFVKIDMDGVLTPDYLRDLPAEQRMQLEEVEGTVHMSLLYGLDAGKLVTRRAMTLVDSQGHARLGALYEDMRGRRLIPGDVAEARLLRNFLRDPLLS